ncbi:hypothetical protein DB30_00104 [Enhygromyxa salina]|uniref:Uncharacterized protein n=1 Tax=Enhygromyxa salina TaxID=215803 RepID=A0A0C2DDS4_9BACT|nr:hypothetical protein DB30_00104 [Enhygromyxa salina]
MFDEARARAQQDMLARMPAPETVAVGVQVDIQVLPNYDPTRATGGRPG